MPGEVVFDRERAARLDRFLGVRGTRGRGGASSGNTLNFTANVSMLSGATTQERKRFLLEMNRDMEELVRDGLILRNMARA